MYPIFLMICRYIAGQNHFLLLAIVLQHILYLVSIYYFHKTAGALFTQRLSLLLTILYAFLPCLTSWGNTILTENFVIIGVVMLLYSAIAIWKNGSFKHVVAFGWWTLFLVFLRPSFLYLLPVFAVLTILQTVITKEKLRWAALSSFVLTLAVAGCVYAYMNAFEARYGVKAITQVSTVNNYYMLRLDGLIDTTLITDDALKADVVKSIIKNGKICDPHDAKTGYEGLVFIQKHGLKSVNQVVSSAMNANKAIVARKCVGRMYRASNSPLFESYVPGLNTLFDMLSPNMSMLYVFLVLYTAVLLTFIYRRRILPFTSLTIWMLGVSNLVVAIVGAQSEWARLVLPSMPLYLLMVGQLCSMVTVKLKSRDERQLQ